MSASLSDSRTSYIPCLDEMTKLDFKSGKCQEEKCQETVKTTPSENSGTEQQPKNHFESVLNTLKLNVENDAAGPHSGFSCIGVDWTFMSQVANAQATLSINKYKIIIVDDGKVIHMPSYTVECVRFSHLCTCQQCAVHTTTSDLALVCALGEILCIMGTVLTGIFGLIGCCRGFGRLFHTLEKMILDYQNVIGAYNSARRLQTV
uniref:Uncharacterized protein n=1 Tax=Setaria digitata TaxID=48799 RepID=A0A915PIZ8_9BILA